MTDPQPYHATRVFARRCEGTSTDLRYQLSLQAYDPLPARTLAHHLGALLFTPDLIHNLQEDTRKHLLESDQWSALLVSHEPPVILHHPHHSPQRTESSIMHELAHLLLKHPPVTPTHQDHEKEAQKLGACLQLPRRALLWATQNHMTLQAIADHYGCSTQLVQFRCTLTGIHPQ